jgi:predicted lipid carrier protein YhbT
VPEFLSPEWLDAMIAAATTAHLRAGDIDLAIEQVVTGRPAGEVAWTVRVHDGRVEVESGRTPAPSISFTVDADTAQAIHSGRQSAQAAFMTGRLRLGGDVALLLDHQGTLSELEDVFADVRASTTYADATTTDTPPSTLDRSHA